MKTCFLTSNTGLAPIPLTKIMPLPDRLGLGLMMQPSASYLALDWQHLDISGVMDLTQSARSTIYDLMVHEGFPRPYKLASSGRAVRWLRREVVEWLACRAKAEGRTATKGGDHV